MKNNKSKKIFIIAIIIVLILIAGTVFAMFATNMFKSDKEMFFRYASQIFDNENGFIDSKLEQYNEKKNSNAYDHEGTFTVSVDDKSFGDFNISFAGNIDNPSNRKEEAVKVNYTENVNFPISYKKIDDLHAIKLSDVSKRYFGVSESNFGDLISKLNSSSNMEQKAKEASIKTEIEAAKDSINAKAQDILVKNYSSQATSSESLGQLVLKEEYESNGVIIKTEEKDTDDVDGYVGTITITSVENSTYYLKGTVSEKGGIHWGSISSGSVQSENNNSIRNIDLSSLALTNEEKNKLKDTYLPAIEDSLDNASFTKISTMESDGYSLELSNEKFKEILIKLLEVLKQDEMMLDKLKNLTGQEITTNSIEKLINNIRNSETTEGSSIITVYETLNQLSKIEIQYNDQFKITISKSSSDDTVSYNIDLESQSYMIGLKIDYSGLQSLEKIQEKYELKMNLDKEYSYNIENNVSFENQDIQIDDFKENEFIDLSKLSNENLNKLLSKIAENVAEVNNDKIKEAEINSIDVLSFIPGVVAQKVNEVKTNQSTQETKNDTKNETNSNSENSNIISNNTSTNPTSTSTNTNASNSLVTNMENASKDTFNSRFQQYEGDSVRGATVKSLLMQVIANNMLDEDEGGRPIEITGDIKLTGNEVPETVQTTKKYTVKCSTNSEGYVNKIDIKEVK